MSSKHQAEGESKPVPPKQFDAPGMKELSDPGKSRKNCEDASNVVESVPVKESGKME